MERDAPSSPPKTPSKSPSKLGKVSSAGKKMLKMGEALSEDGRVKYEYDPWKSTNGKGKAPCCVLPCYIPGAGPTIECAGAAAKTAVMGCAIIPCLAPLAPVLPMVAGKLYNCVTFPMYKGCLEPTKPEPPQLPGKFQEGGGRTICVWHLPGKCCSRECECNHCNDICGFAKTCCNCMGCEGKCDSCHQCMDTFDCCKYCDFGARCRTCFGPFDGCLDLFLLTLQCPLAIMTCDIGLLMEVPVCGECMAPCLSSCKGCLCKPLEACGSCCGSCATKCGCGSCCKSCGCCGSPDVDVGPPTCCGCPCNPYACCEGVDGRCCYCWKPMGSICGIAQCGPHTTCTMCCPCCPSISSPCCYHDEIIEAPPVATYIIYRKDEQAETSYKEKIAEYKAKYKKMKEEGLGAVAKDEAKSAMKGSAKDLASDLAAQASDSLNA